MKLEIDNLVAGYDKLQILNGVDLTASSEQICGIVGPNGAGKSTLFKSIFHLTNIVSGRIRYAELDITKANPRQTITRGLGYVPQHEAHFPAMTVKENLLMAAYTLSRRGARRAIKEAGETFPILRERWSQKVGTLSGGEQRVLDFARAMVLKPSMILVDEPSAGLDPKGVVRIYDTIVRINAGGPGFLIVEQDVPTVLAYATYVYALELGRVAHHGEPEMFSDNELLRNLYLGN